QALVLLGISVGQALRVFEGGVRYLIIGVVFIRLSREQVEVRVLGLDERVVFGVVPEEALHAGLAWVDSPNARFLGPLAIERQVARFGKIHTFLVSIESEPAAVADAVLFAVLSEIDGCAAVYRHVPDVPAIS